MVSNKKAFLFIHCCIAIAGIYAPGAIAQEANVDVCHIPPENPDNAHTITISENALGAHLDHGDRVAACNSEQTVEVHESGSQAESACACPRPGAWRVTNLTGYMECNVLGIKRKLRGSGKNDGTIWILNDDCSNTFLEADEKGRENVIMERGRECLYFGFATGEEQGAKVIFDGAYKVETEEIITGEFYLEMSSVGADCSGYRPFEMEYMEPLDEKNYAEREETMQEALGNARETLEEHREQIDEYLEDTDGGKALGGRNPQE